jgi:UDP-N-acetylmuramoylalanine-D-glutamate ligase
VQVAGLITLPGTGPALADAVEAAVADGAGTHPDQRPPAVRRIAGDDPHAVMSAAVAAARDVAPPGATILLSPAAPSHNVFRDFEDRGDRFAAAVAALSDAAGPHGSTPPRRGTERG